MKVCAISDLHGTLPQIDKCDLLLIAGDISPLNIQFNKIEMWKWLNTEFLAWIKELSTNKVILIAGNHDAIFTILSNAKLLELEFNSNNKLLYLENQVYNYNKGDDTYISIFGTPYCHIFGNWPFMIDDVQLEQKFSEIPNKIDILLTHDAPYNIGNQDIVSYPNKYNTSLTHVGNKQLRNKLEKINYKWLIHGHLHDTQHVPEEFNSGKIVNVSILDDSYENKYKPFYFEI